MRALIKHSDSTAQLCRTEGLRPTGGQESKLQAGGVIVEAVIVAPLLILMFIGAAELIHMFRAYNWLSGISRQAVVAAPMLERFAICDGSSPCNPQQPNPTDCCMMVQAYPDWTNDIVPCLDRTQTPPNAWRCPHFLAQSRVQALLESSAATGFPGIDPAVTWSSSFDTNTRVFKFEISGVYRTLFGGLRAHTIRAKSSITLAAS